MPMYGLIEVIIPYDLIKHWRSIHKDDAPGRFTSWMKRKIPGHFKIDHTNKIQMLSTQSAHFFQVFIYRGD